MFLQLEHTDEQESAKRRDAELLRVLEKERQKEKELTYVVLPLNQLSFFNHVPLFRRVMQGRHSRFTGSFKIANEGSTRTRYYGSALSSINTHSADKQKVCDRIISGS